MQNIHLKKSNRKWTKHAQEYLERNQQSPTFHQHLRRTRRDAPVIEQHAFIDPFVITSHCLNVEIVWCALWRLRESRPWADQVIILKPFNIVDGFWTGRHLNRKQRV